MPEMGSNKTATSNRCARYYGWHAYRNTGRTG